MRLRHLLRLTAAAAALAGAVQAQPTITPMTVKDGNQQPQSLCEYKPDGTNFAGCSIVGFIGVALHPTVTVQAAAYSAGSSLGGLIPAPNAVRGAGGSGSLISMGLQSAGGSTNLVYAYAFSRNPTASTCADRTAFVLGAADRPYLIGGAPVALQLGSSPGTFDAATYASLVNMNLRWANEDGPPGRTLYLCLVTAGAVTPASTSDLTLRIWADQD